MTISPNERLHIDSELSRRRFLEFLGYTTATAGLASGAGRVSFLATVM